LVEVRQRRRQHGLGSAAGFEAVDVGIEMTASERQPVAGATNRRVRRANSSDVDGFGRSRAVE